MGVVEHVRWSGSARVPKSVGLDALRRVRGPRALAPREREMSISHSMRYAVLRHEDLPGRRDRVSPLPVLVVIFISAMPSNCARAAAPRRGGCRGPGRRGFGRRMAAPFSGRGAGSLPGEQIRQKTVGARARRPEAGGRRRGPCRRSGPFRASRRGAPPFCTGPPGSAIASSGVYSGAQVCAK